MKRRATERLKDRVYLIQREDEHGRRVRVQFVGDIRLKPKGWRVVAYLGAAMAGNGSGLAYS